jgi:hypothetical protein
MHESSLLEATHAVLTPEMAILKRALAIRAKTTFCKALAALKAAETDLGDLGLTFWAD